MWWDSHENIVFEYLVIQGKYQIPQSHDKIKQYSNQLTKSAKVKKKKSEKNPPFNLPKAAEVGLNL